MFTQDPMHFNLSASLRDAAAQYWGVRTVYTKAFAAGAAFVAFAVSPALSNGFEYGYKKRPHINLTIEEPGGQPNRLSSYYPIYLPEPYASSYGKRRDRSLLTEDGWTLSFRLAAKDSPALISTRLSNNDGGPNFETLVLKDPDGCLDLSHAKPTFDPRMSPPALSPIEDNCPAIQDEKFVLFNIDYDDAPGVRDTYISGGCEGPKRERLIDDPYDEIEGNVVDFRDSNKAYVIKDPTSMFATGSPVGPFTGGAESTFDPTSKLHEDCYGYGSDEDLTSLVVMVNTGAARIFDANLVYDNTRIRNMAGFISGVTRELIDKNDATTVVAHMPIRPRMLTPLTFFDIDRVVGIGDPIPASFDILRKIEDGLAESLTITGAATDADIVNELIALTPNEFKVEIRAVVVEGAAPEFIDDTNNDGRFTAADLTPAYNLLSNEAVRWINIVTTPSLAEERDDFECPPLNFVDLNLNGEEQFCEDGDGTSRSAVRRPR